MSVQASAVKIAVLLAVTLAASAPAFAQDMKGMDMSGHEMPQMSGTKASDPSNMKEGEMDSMSDEAMDHDTHMGGGAMKNMSLHMDFTDLRPANDADKARAAVLVTDLQHALAKYKDYHVAEADGFKPFHPEFKQRRSCTSPGTGTASKPRSHSTRTSRPRCSTSARLTAATS